MFVAQKTLLLRVFIAFQKYPLSRQGTKKI